jgi:hypothetical protein
MSSEIAAGDQWWTNTIVTTTADAVMNQPVYQLVDGGGITGGDGPGAGLPNHPYDLVDFKYTSTSGALTIAGSTFPASSISGGLIGASMPNPVSGTINITGTHYYSTAAVGTITYQWVIWGADATPLLGPVTTTTSPPPAGHNYFEWLNFDTTTLADGTYIIYPRILDASAQVAYGLQPQGWSMLVANHPPVSTGSQTIPVAPHSSEKGSSPRADFVSYTGVPNPVHNTYPVPYTPIMGANNPSSPYHSNPALLRNIDLYYWENQCGPHTDEYFRTPEFMTSKSSGGVYVGWLDPLGGTTTPAAYPGVILFNSMAGTRLNNIISPFSNYVEDPTTPGKWWGCEVSGRVFWLNQHGDLTVVAGGTRDRTRLTYDPGESDTTSDDVAGIQTFVGNFPPGIDFGGANDLCFDPRNSNWLYVVAQVDGWIGAINLATSPATVTVFAGQSGVTGYTGDGGPATSATFDEPSSIIMDASGNMYVCDSNNSAIRKITSPTPGTSGTITTLCGGSVGPTPPGVVTATAANGPYAVSSITWSGSTVYGAATAPGSGHVLMSVPIPGIQPGWSLDLSGATNTGAGAVGDPNTRYSVLSVNSTSDFVVIAGPVYLPDTGPASIGTIGGSPAFTSWNADVFSPPGTVSFADAYVVFPNTIRFTSQGNIIFNEMEYATIRLINLSESPQGGYGANTITRIGCVAGYLFPATTTNPLAIDTWIWHDVDYVGTIGPVDDIVIEVFNSSLLGAFFGWRMSLQASSTIPIPGIPEYGGTFFNSGNSLPTYGQQVGGAHYEWAVSISRLEGRAIFTGIADFWPTMIRIQQPSDPSIAPGMYWDEVTYNRGFGIHNQGTCNGFPWELRPSFWGIWGPNGVAFHNTLTFDDLMHGSYASTTPGDAGDMALLAFIQSGMGGAVPRPEFSATSDGKLGNDARDYIYWIRRQTLQGSIGTNIGGVNTPVAPAANNPDNLTPQILSFTAAQTDTLATIKFTWTTDKQTIGLACCGSATQALTYGYYPIFSELESSFGTTHSATLVSPPGITPLHCSVVVKDLAGNFAHAKEIVLNIQSGISNDGTSILTGTQGILVTKYGVWSFGDPVEPAPAYNPAGGPQSRILLNGVSANLSNNLCVQKLIVDFSGNLYGLFGGSDQFWYGWFNYDWGSAGSPTLTGGTPGPLPTYSPPYTPSPDGTSLANGASGTVITTEGNFSFGTVNGSGWNINLNGIQISGFGAIKTLEVNAHGVLYMQDTFNAWYTWVGYVLRNSTGPQSGPVPIDIHFSPPNPQISLSSSPGTSACTAAITTSNGSPFTGTLAVISGGGVLQASFISGVWHIVTGSVPLAASNVVNVEATQNGANYSVPLDVNAS